MYGSVLVPLDGSATAECVLPYVEELVSRCGSDLVLARLSQGGPPDIKRLCQVYLGNVVDRIQRELRSYTPYRDARIYREVLPGEAAGAIVRYAQDRHVDLVAIASPPAPTKGSGLLANAAARVLAVIAKPVLLVHPPLATTALQNKRRIKKILVPLDGSPTGEQVLPDAITLARAMEAELVLLHVVERYRTWVAVEGGAYEVSPDARRLRQAARGYLEGLSEPIIRRGLRVTRTVLHGRPPDQIINYARLNAIDLIAMSRHKRSGFERRVFGSVTDIVMQAGDAPVLIVRAA